MKRITISPTLLAWGLAVAGAGVLYVSGGCRIINKIQENQERRRAVREERLRPATESPPRPAYELPPIPVPPTATLPPKP